MEPIRMTFRSLVSLGCVTAVTISSIATGQELLRIHDGDSFPNQTAGVIIGDWLGRIFPLEDIDGDGVDDYAMHGFLGRTTSGFYSLHSGQTGVALSPKFSLVVGGGYGQVVTQVGDFDGDGKNDIAVQRPGRRVEIVEALTNIEIASLVFPGPSSGQGYGRTVVPLGDINGDGYDDVAVGAEERDKVGIHLGPDGTLFAAITTLGGTVLATVGDIDGDGISDLLIADGPFNVVTALSCATLQPIYVAFGPPIATHNPYFGNSIAAMSDLDGDGVRDFVVGAPATNQPIAGLRRGFVEYRSGATGDLIRHVDGPFPREEPYAAGFPPRDQGAFGFHVASGADVNGDGYDDVMITSPQRYLWDTPFRGADTLLSGRTGEALADLELWDRNDPASGSGGQWSVVLGDFDGDGLSEFAVGSANDNRGGEKTGRVWIFRGFRADAVPRCAPPAHSGGVQARVVTDGSLALSVQDMWLRVLGAPPSSQAVLFTTPGVQTTAFPPFGLCVGGPGTLRLSGALPTDVDGTAEIQLDQGGPVLATIWLPGTHWTVQAAFRDAPSASGLGVTNALVIQWGP